MFNQIPEPLVIQFGFIRPVRIIKRREQTSQSVRIGMFNTHHCIDNRLANVFAGFPYVFPMTAFRNNECMQLILWIVLNVIAVFFLKLMMLIMELSPSQSNVNR